MTSTHPIPSTGHAVKALARRPNRVSARKLRAETVDLSWGGLAATVLLYLSLALPVTHLIRGSDWLGWYIGFGVMIFAIGLIGRSLGLANGLVGVIEGALVPPALTAAFASDVAWLWVIPNARVWDRFTDLGADLGRAFLLEASPLVAGEWIFAFVALAGALLAWVFDWYVFTVKAPAATGLFAALVGVVAVAFVRPGLPLTAFVPMAVAYLLLLLVTTPGARPRLAGIGVVAGAVALGLAAGQVTPGLGIGGLITGKDRGDVHIGGANPLMDLGEDLRASPSTEALRYVSSVGPVYLRLTSLTDFDGTTWLRQPGEQEYYTPGSDDYPSIPGSDPSVVGSVAFIEVEIVDLNSDWLPVPYQPVGLQGVGRLLQIDADDLTVSFAEGRTEDQSYSAAAWRPDPSSDQARARVDDPLSADQLRRLEPATALPEDLPEIIGKTARAAVSEVAEDPLAQGLALEAYFRESDFVYSMSTPAREGYDGDSGAVVARFLEVKAGYCVHFAAAMTLMARELGIPARVAIGYLPGNPVSGDGGRIQYSVAADRLHSWPELFIPGSGWVGFEPTVTRGVSSGYESAAPALPSASSSPSGASASASASASRSDSPSPSASPRPSPSPSSGTGSSDDADRGAALSWQIWSACAGALLLAAAAAPGIWRMVLRRRRLRGDLAGLWTEVVATAVDFGMAAPPSRTPAALASSLAAWLDDNSQSAAAQALERLHSALEASVYAPPPSRAASTPGGTGSSGPPNPSPRADPSALADAKSVLRGLRRSHPLRSRLATWWFPRSTRRLSARGR
ncbi:MAG: transglutaminaseTgpA domain-containing protein [Bifidobacteriaceae bacterium]|jgi:transglutaminase-like putative cysteine protease|nr:transglutaminaseTgpA domain-containing protein [Bifidobacteriaceae bacterium]